MYIICSDSVSDKEKIDADGGREVEEHKELQYVNEVPRVEVRLKKNATPVRKSIP